MAPRNFPEPSSFQGATKYVKHWPFSKRDHWKPAMAIIIDIPLQKSLLVSWLEASEWDNDWRLRWVTPTRSKPCRGTGTDIDFFDKWKAIRSIPPKSDIAASFRPESKPNIEILSAKYCLKSFSMVCTDSKASKLWPIDLPFTKVLVLDRNNVSSVLPGWQRTQKSSVDSSRSEKRRKTQGNQDEINPALAVTRFFVLSWIHFRIRTKDRISRVQLVDIPLTWHCCLLSTSSC